MIRPGVKLTFDRRQFNRLKMNTALDEELGSLDGESGLLPNVSTSHSAKAIPLPAIIMIYNPK